MKVGLVQKNLVVGDVDGNVERLLDGIRGAREQGADLAVCSELAIIGYPPRDLLDRPALVEANLGGLERLAKSAELPTLVGFVARDPSGLRNAVAVLCDGAVQSVHEKSLLPSYDVFDERRYFEPAAGRALAFIHGVPIGITICEDNWTDDSFGRRYNVDPPAELAQQGAKLLINVSASPFSHDKRDLRRSLFSKQASKHRLPLLFVNQVGGNDDLVFDGGSAAFNARGDTVAHALEFREDVLVVNVDPSTGDASGPNRATSHADSENDIGPVLDALILGTRDYALKCGFRSVLVGLSGGIDSAVTATIAEHALGKDAVYGVAMPSRISSDHSIRDAELLARHLGIEYDVVSIEAPHRAFEECLRHMFRGTEPGTAEENIQARARGVVLMALSNKFGHLLLTTGNKSELAVGYCTLYGDMSGGYAVLSDVPKTWVYHLADELNRRDPRTPIPRASIEKPPSAELRSGQTDQDSLPPYDVLDQILEQFIEKGLSTDEVIACGFDESAVRDVVKRVRTNEYKRYQAAPGPKISAKAFGPGRRMPLAARWE